MEFKDYYKTLGVGKKATEAEIKKEYRKLARKYHPDVNKEADAEKKFKEIAEAYEVLKDPEKRKAYDEFGKDWKAGKEQKEYQKQYYKNYQQAQGPEGFDTGGFGGAGFDFGDRGGDFGEYSEFFENLFGSRRPGSAAGGRSRSFSRKGQDMNAGISIPLEDAYHGATRRISFESPKLDSGGRMRYEPVTLNVKIPKGVQNGKKIRLAGKGGPGINGGQAGDLYITIEYESNKNYHVEGADVYLNVPVAPWEAALGESVSVPTPTGNIKLKIPKGSATGKKLRLKGKGIPSKPPGDLYVVLKVVYPPADTDSANKVYEDMKSLNFDPRKTFKL